MNETKVWVIFRIKIFRSEIDQEDSLSPAVIRMTKRIFRYQNY